MNRVMMINDDQNLCQKSHCCNFDERVRALGFHAARYLAGEDLRRNALSSSLESEPPTVLYTKRASLLPWCRLGNRVASDSIDQINNLTRNLTKKMNS